MHALRQARFLARLVLGWFVVSLGVAVAAPVLQPGLQFICTANAGFQLLPAGDGTAPQPHTMDCPLCAAVAPPPCIPGMSHALGESGRAFPPPGVQVPVVGAPTLPPARGPPAAWVS